MNYWICLLDYCFCVLILSLLALVAGFVLKMFCAFVGWLFGLDPDDNPFNGFSRKVLKFSMWGFIISVGMIAWSYIESGMDITTELWLTSPIAIVVLVWLMGGPRAFFHKNKWDTQKHVNVDALSYDDPRSPYFSAWVSGNMEETQG